MFLRSFLEHIPCLSQRGSSFDAVANLRVKRDQTRPSTSCEGATRSSRSELAQIALDVRDHDRKDTSDLWDVFMVPQASQSRSIVHPKSWT
jgi:hypothetical protein